MLSQVGEAASDLLLSEEIDKLDVTELGKVVKEVRAGNGVEVMKTQLKSMLEELSRVKKENLRLKRELGGLKAVRADIEVSAPAKDVVEIPDA